MLPAEAHGTTRPARLAAGALALSLVAALALGAGCGDDDAGDAQADTGATELTIALDIDGPKGEPGTTETASCEAGADDSPCAAITPADFDPVPANVACTEIYGGPDEAMIEGTVAGETVAGTFTRANGCEIDRFDRFTPLLQELFPGYTPGSAIAP